MHNINPDAGPAEYIKSSFLQSIDCLSGYQVVFHSFFGRAMYLDRRLADILNYFSSPRILPEAGPVYAELLQEFVRRGFIVRPDVSERKEITDHYRGYSPVTPSGLCLNMATICNFRCFHCIHFACHELESRSLSPGRMPFETAIAALEWVAEGVRQTGQNRLAVNFGGGEPLINWPVIERVLEYSRNRIQPSTDIDFSINTNASLMTPQIVRVLRKHDVRIIASLDGTRAGNDLVRRTRNGRPAFDLIRQGFARLADGGMPVMALHVNLNSKNFDRLDETFIEFLDREKIQSITLEPDLTDRLEQPVSDLVEKIMHLKKTAQEKGITVTGYWERPFARIVQPEPDSSPYFCRSISGQAIDVMPDGSLYSCSYTGLKLGNLDFFMKKGPPSQLLKASPFKTVLEARRIGQIKRCRGCRLEGVCGGGCYATVAHALKRKKPAILDYRCDFYRRITERLLADAAAQSISGPGKAKERKAAARIQ